MDGCNYKSSHNSDHKPLSPSADFGNSDSLGFDAFPPSGQLSMHGFFPGD
jgi:hypothetical protein